MFLITCIAHCARVIGALAAAVWNAAFGLDVLAPPLHKKDNKLSVSLEDRLGVHANEAEFDQKL